MGHLADLLVSGWAIISLGAGLGAGYWLGRARPVHHRRRRFVA